MYKVTSDLKLKVQGVIKVFPVGSVINLPEKSAQMFIQQGKIVSIPEEPEKDTYGELCTFFETKSLEPTERDREFWTDKESESESLSERMAIMGENCSPEQTEPFVTDFGVLVIPFNIDKEYHYWDGGQSVCDTLKELGRCDLIEKYKSPYSN